MLKGKTINRVDYHTKQTDKTIELLMNGSMCSNAVIGTYAEDFGLSMDLAFRISDGFAGGMAQGKTCGAVTGAFMVIGLKFGAGVQKDQYSKDFCFQLVQEFSHRFENRQKTMECGKILVMNGINPHNPDEMRNLRETGLCEKIVRDASEILEDILFENR